MIEQMRPLLIDFLVALVSLAIIMLTSYIKKVANKYEEKLDAETQAKIQEVVGICVAQGASFAEQWAKKTETELGEGVKVPSADKLSKATEYALNDLKRHGIIDFSEKEISDKVESFLGIGTMNANALDIFPQQKEDNDDPPQFFTSND